MVVGSPAFYANPGMTARFSIRNLQDKASASRDEHVFFQMTFLFFLCHKLSGATLVPLPRVISLALDLNTHKTVTRSDAHADFT